MSAIQKYSDYGILRIGTMFPLLPTSCADSELRDALEEIRGDMSDAQLKERLGWAWQEDMDAEEVMDNLSYQRDGYLLARVSTPVFDAESPDVFSWGYTTYTWFVGKNLEEIIDRGVKWAKSTLPRKKAKKSK